MKKIFQLWEKIFEDRQFDLTQDLHFITANDIKNITNKEPRIMAKMDNSSDLPDVFKRNGYFLLPVKNGRYAIVRGNGFHVLEQRGESESHTSRIKFQLTTAGRGSSEMQYLDYSFNSGALEKVIGIEPLYQSIRGREFSKAFSFYVNKTLLDVASVQLEVDSGLEGENSIVLIEAKINIPEDFIVRQLFYPYNHFKKIAPNKDIIPVFFTYEPKQGVYTFWIYEFEDPKNYNSIKLKEVKSLKIITDHELKLDDIHPKGIVEYKDLIPQANDLDKVIELVFKVSEGFNDYQKIAQYFNFDERQSSYYREAAGALGLVSAKEGKYYLTEAGRLLVKLPTEKRNIFVVELLSDFNLVKQGLDLLKSSGELQQEDVEKIIASSSKLSGSTVPRRAGSLMAWFKWIAESTGSAEFDKGMLKMIR
jgi:hypothetical protein